MIRCWSTEGIATSHSRPKRRKNKLKKGARSNPRKSDIWHTGEAVQHTARRWKVQTCIKVISEVWQGRCKGSNSRSKKTKANEKKRSCENDGGKNEGGGMGRAAGIQKSQSGRTPADDCKLGKKGKEVAKKEVDAIPKAMPKQRSGGTEEDKGKEGKNAQKADADKEGEEEERKKVMLLIEEKARQEIIKEAEEHQQWRKKKEEQKEKEERAKWEDEGWTPAQWRKFFQQEDEKNERIKDHKRGASSWEK
jgi:hypothetical protein